MWFREIDIPKDITNAQQDGTLVIFAGAGVSKANPSNLPNFKELTKKLAENTKFQNQVQSPYEKVLGKMEDSNINIRNLTYNIFSSKTSKPSRLHYDLLKLFHKDKVRLVTTNFDTHFSSVLKEHRLNIETYYAPALPLGKNFKGLVYLHGAIDKNSENLVLTDKDFSEAYLVEAWATRFVKDMLLNNTVLFIGYSYDDVMMNYLSRGLPQDTKSFILIAKDKQNEDWTQLGLIPITYPNDKKDHLELILGIQKWSEYLSKSDLDHKRKIMEIASARPPIDREEADYMVDRIQNEQYVKEFTKHANKPEWIKWTNDKKLLEDIFDLNSDIKEFSTNEYFVEWLADQFMLQHHKDLIDLIVEHDQKIHLIFWNKLACNIQQKYEDFSKTSNICILKLWITFLIDKASDRSDNQLLSYILYKYRFSQDLRVQQIAFQIFIFLIKPRLKLEVKKSFKSDFIQYETIVNTATSLNVLDQDLIITILKEVWNELFKNRLNIFGKKLFCILTNNIQEIHDQYLLTAKNPETNDSSCFKRPAIERHNENNKNTANNQDFHFLLDIFSDLMIWISLNSKQMTETALKWIDLDVIWLKRFAIFTMEKTKFYTPKQKLDWFKNNRLIENVQLYHELCGLMKEIYLKINHKNDKILLINLIKSLPSKNKPEAIRYLRFLKKSFPECDLINDAINKSKYLSVNYPFRSQSDFSFINKIEFFKIEMNCEKSPYSVDELLQLNLEEHLEKLLNWDAHLDARHSLFSNIQRAVVRDFDWSLKLCNLLIDKSHQKIDLWICILQGWADSNFNEKQWQTILSYLTNHHFILENFAYHSSKLLLEGVTKTKHIISFSELNHAMDLAEKLWNMENKKDSVKHNDKLVEEGLQKHTKDAQDARDDHQKNKEVKIDWISFSINTKAGKLSEFWHHALALTVKESGNKKIPQRIKNNLNLILKEDSHQAHIGQVIIAIQLHFLYSLEKEWVLKQIIPRFDIEKNKNVQRFWEGYLYSGRLSNELFIEMRPLFKKLFDKPQIFQEKMQKIFIESIITLSIYAEISPLENEWLFSFVQGASDQSLEIFAYELSRRLKDVKPEDRSRAWRKWMKKYFEERMHGRPKPLNDKEKSDMISVPLVLTDKQDYKEAVKIILQWECSQVDIFLFLYRLKHNDEEYNPIQKHPILTLKLFNHVLKDRKRQEPFFFQAKGIEEIARSFIKRLKNDPKNKLILREMCEILFQIGFEDAEKLQQEIEK